MNSRKKTYCKKKKKSNGQNTVVKYIVYNIIIQLIIKFVIAKKKF